MPQQKICIAVVRGDGGWRVVAPGRGGVICAYKVDAEEAAIRLAQRLRRERLEVDVLVQDRFGRLDALQAA